MTLLDFYLVCFITGCLLSVLSFLLGGLHVHLHLPFHIHIPGFGGHVHVGGGGSQLSVINFGTLTAFLAWFGGIGYLLERHSHVAALTAILLSVLAGVVGAATLFIFVSKVLFSRESALDPADYEMVGVLGNLISPIREGGVGEIVYTQEGIRYSAPARSELGAAIPKGDEVVVTRFERGIAYVRRWEELESASGSSAANSLQ
jgi:membrane protein implicated in regulation of membrane protease activity